MTFIHGSHELCQFRQAGQLRTIQVVMKEAMTEFFDLAPEKALAYLFDRLPVGTAVIDREFRLRRCNPTWAEFIERYTPSSVADVVPGVSLFDLEPGTEEVIKPLFAPVFAGETVRQEGVRLQSGGIVSYWDVVLVPLEVNGEVVAALDVSLDATAHVLSQQKLQNTLDALQASEAHLRSMLESAQGYAIYRLAVDLDHPYLCRVMLVSPSIREVIGIDDPFDFSGWFGDIHPEDEPRIVAANRRAVTDGVPFDEELRVFHKRRGEWRWVHTVSNPIFDENGRLTHFNGITIDITAQKQAQETLAQINQVLEQQVAERTREIQRRNLELEALYQADEELLQHLELDPVLQSLVDVAVDVLQADKSSLMVWDQKHERLIVRAAHGFRPETLVQMNFGPAEGSVGRVAVTGEMVVVEDAQKDEHVIKHIIEAEGIRSFMHVPITVGENVFGVFNVDYAEPRTFSPDERRLFTALAQRAGLAVENAQLYQFEQKRRRESERRRRGAESLRTILAMLNANRPLPEVLETIAQLAGELMGPETAVAIFQYNATFEGYELRASHHLPQVLRQLQTLPIAFVGGEAFKRKEPFVVSDLTAYAEQLLPLVPPDRPELLAAVEGLQHHFRSYLAVPLLVRNQLYGGIAFHFTDERTFDEEELTLAFTLCEQAALAIENARLHALEHERREIAEGLRDILGVLNSNRPLPEVLDFIIAQASRVMEAEISLLYRIDYERNFMVIEGAHGLPEDVQDIGGFPLINSPVDQLILNRQPAAGPIDHTTQRKPFPGIDPAIIMRWHTHVTDRHDAFLAIPLVVRNAVYGRLTFYYAHARTFGQEDIDQAMLFGDQAALAIENAQLRENAEQMAVMAERNRLARELHDAVTQTLFSASLIADVLPRMWERNPELGQVKLAELRELTRGALAEMRTLLLELRPATLTESSLAELLQQLAAAIIGRSRLQVAVEVDGERPLPAETQVALYRIAQEALNNVVKHAGADQVTITLLYEKACVELTVVDNGRGFDPASVGVHSLGLSIMRERAAKIAAEFWVESIIGAGTKICVRVCE